MQIKSAASASGIMGEVELHKDIRSALRDLGSGPDRTAIFVSDEFTTEDMSQFLAEAKRTPGAKNSAFIINIKSKDADQSAIATTILRGFDGMLVEPFSVDAIEEIIRVSSSIHAERNVESQRAAVQYLTVQLLSALDRVATAKAMEKPPGENIRELKSISSDIASLDPVLHQIYFQALITESDKKRPPEELVEYFRRQAEAEARAQDRMDKMVAEHKARQQSSESKKGPRIIRRS
jgi:hypothetical protein